MSASRWPAPSRTDPQADAEQEPQLKLVAAYRQQVVDAAKSAGTKSARRGDPDLYAEALEAIALRASSGEVFDADDIRGDLAGASGPAVGSAFREAAARGLIHPYGVTTSRSVASHGRLLRSWRGAL
jgi:hypothetical protein